ncbi:MAG: hypothetical protein AB7F86_00325 [Bdellovibrionales bacterium]
MDFHLEDHSFQGVDPSPGRSKTSQRLKYEAEIRVFRSKYGGLEQVRQGMGLTRRKICQLLMVDPSAWTRWLRDEDKVPPAIYRSLESMILLNEKNPDLMRVLGSRVSQSLGIEKSSELKLKIEHLEAELDALKSKNLASTAKAMTLLIGLFFLAILVLLMR